MKILVVEPMKTPTVQEIDGSLRSMQRIVGGDIEAVYPFDDPVAIVCHGVPYDIVCGTFFVVGIGDENFTSLTEQQVEKYGKKYAREMVLDVSVTPKKQKNHSNKEKNQHER